MTLRHFTDISLLGGDDLRWMLERAHKMKRAMKKGGRALPRGLQVKAAEGAILAMIFEKPSTRTRVSFDVAMRQIGGETIVLNRDDLQLGRGETISDTAQVLSRYVDAIMLRVLMHTTLMEFVAHATVPVINGLSDTSHPCQIIADIMTFEEVHGPIGGRTVAWVGDGNNVATSWVHAAVRLGFELRIATPKSLAPKRGLIDWARSEGGTVTVTTSARKAVSGADCITTDTWVSMGDKNVKQRLADLDPYRVDAKMMKAASADAIFMHCLPAYRGQEVSGDVIDGPQSVVFDEAENRLHAQKAILAWCLDG
ncbi:MAG: ornithine carbamoyltransferase [Hyphomicrobiaceae bacterium]